MGTATLRNADHRIFTFTAVSDTTTAVRSGWDRAKNGMIFWDGAAKVMARKQAIAYFRQLQANGWSIVP